MKSYTKYQKDIIYFFYKILIHLLVGVPGPPHNPYIATALVTKLSETMHMHIQMYKDKSIP